MKGRGFPSDWALLYLCSGVRLQGREHIHVRADKQTSRKRKKQVFKFLGSDFALRT